MLSYNINHISFFLQTQNNVVSSVVYKWSNLEQSIIIWTFCTTVLEILISLLPEDDRWQFSNLCDWLILFYNSMDNTDLRWQLLKRTQFRKIYWTDLSRYLEFIFSPGRHDSLVVYVPVWHAVDLRSIPVR